MGQEIEVEAQIRYRSNPVKGTLIPLKNLDNTTTTFKLIFEESQSSVTPGQAAVFYEGNDIIGGGWIRSSFNLNKNKITKKLIRND